MVLTAKDFEDFKKSFSEQLAKSVEKATRDIKATVAEAVSAAVTPLHAEIVELRELLHESRDKLLDLQDKLIEKTQTIKSLEDKVASSNKNSELRSLIAEKSDLSEQYSRKDCLRIEGIKFDESETNESLQQTVLNKLREHDVVLDKADIHRLHRSGRPYPLNKFKEYANKRKGATNQPIDNMDKTQTAQVIVKCVNWSARSRVFNLHYRKDATINVNCDITKYRTDLLLTARTYLKDNEMKGYCYINAECHLILKDVDADKRQSFSNFADFKFNASKLARDANFHKKAQWLGQTTVINLKSHPELCHHPRFTYIGRRSMYGHSSFGNPYKIPPPHSRGESQTVWDSCPEFTKTNGHATVT